MKERMKPAEKVVLAVVEERRPGDWPIEETVEEMRSLIAACGGAVVETVVCRADPPSAALFIGEGKARELAVLCAAEDVDTVVFSRDLKGGQQRNLEAILKVKTIDRTQLILDIFAHRAVSLEGKMQVELAQLEYLRPRLVGKGIALSRLGGGIGTLGPGETKLEVDRRRIAARIARLKRDLEGIAADRAVKRKRRRDKGIPLISLVGYTNAGKSTLLNRLTAAGRTTRDGLFTTLDPLSRRYVLSNHQKVILSDTVGFMQDLPHHLIEAFKATLEEVVEADLLVVVLDVSHPHHRERYEAVSMVLEELEAKNKPRVTVLNKIDRLSDRSSVEAIEALFPHPVAISAVTGENLEGLDRTIRGLLALRMVRMEVTLPLSRMDLVHLAHDEGQVYAVKYDNDRIQLYAGIPLRYAGLFAKSDMAARGR